MVTRTDLTQAYWQYTGPHRRARDVNVLSGILAGIGFNGRVSDGEAELLAAWHRDHEQLEGPPFSDLRPDITQIIDSGAMSDSQRDALLEVCREYSEAQSRFNKDTTAMQQLHGILGGIAADGVVDSDEVQHLERWLDDHRYLGGLWPYDEVDSLITSFVKSDEVAEQQQDFMMAVCREFVFGPAAQLILENMDELAKSGVCSACPSIDFPGSGFCITGHPERGRKADLETDIVRLGGEVEKNVTKGVDYLIVGAKGNGAWAFNCYGRKVEKAMMMRKDGHRLVLVHEFDFWDAVEDA